jgi:parallel beta-helix repeat protein
MKRVARNASVSDGIYMFNSNANNVTHCELSNNQNFGVSLIKSKNNAFSSNTLSSNAQFGVRLRDGADYNQFSFNTFKANAENGVLIGDSQVTRSIPITSWPRKAISTRKRATTSTPQRRSTIPSAAVRLADLSVTTTQIMLDPMQTGTESEAPRLAEISILLSSLSRTMVWFNRLRRHLLPRLLRHLPLQPHTSVRQAMQVSALQHFCLDSKLCQRCLGCCLQQ